MKRELWGIICRDGNKWQMTAHCYFSKAECDKNRKQLTKEGVWDEARTFKLVPAKWANGLPK